MIDLRNKSEYRMLDIARMVCALLVVAVHIPVLGSGAQGIVAENLNFIISKCISRVAVPYFFISSGFFLFKKTSEESLDWKLVKKFIVHILCLYLIWSLIYLPLRIWEYVSWQMDIKSIIRTYLYNFIFAGSYVHLWYLPALIIATIMVVWGLSRKLSPERLLAISFIFYIVGLFGNSWYGLLTLKAFPLPWITAIYKWLLLVFSTTRNGIFEGFLFVAFGAYCARRKFQFSSGTVGIIGLISCVLMTAESLLLNYFHLSSTYDLKLFLAPTVCCLFLYCANMEMKEENRIYRLLRFCASVIYFVHLWVEAIVFKLSAVMQWNITDSCLEYVIVVLCSLLIAIAVWQLSKYDVFHWIRNIF